MSVLEDVPEVAELPTTPEDLFNVLEKLNITYELFNHDPIFTVEEGRDLKLDIPGVSCRNLFLRDKKKNNFLITAANQTQIDLKTLPEKIGASRLSFGSKDRLWELLGICPGSVCPFTVLNDKDHKVKIILDQFMMESDLINVHPLDNSMSVALTPADLLKFLEFTGHEPQILAF